jgi:hypothetical protein
MKTITEMTRELGGFAPTTKFLEQFAELVRAEAQADEREAILDLVDSHAKNNTDLADAIRARGNT